MINCASRVCMRAGLAALLVSLSTGLFAVTFTTPVNTNYASDSGDDARPSVAAVGTGVWVSVWETTASLGAASGGDTDIAFARSTDNGKTWSDPQPVASDAFTDSADDTHAKVAQGTTGTLLCVWQSGQEGEHDIRFVRSTDGGQTWSAPGFVNDDASSDTRDDIQPALSSDGQGNWMVVWSGAAPDGDYEIYFSRSSDNGVSWSAPVLLNANAASDGKKDDLEASVAGASNGTWVVFWTSGEIPPPGSYLVGPGRYGEPEGVASLLYARSGDFGTSWSSPAILQAGEYAGPWYAIRTISPDLACDGQGTWVATWTFRNVKQFGSTQRGYAYEVNQVRSTDDGQSWPFSQPASTISQGGYSRVVYEGPGRWMMAWWSQEASHYGTLKSVRSVDNAQNWTEVRFTAPGGTNPFEFPQEIASDRSGNVLATWSAIPYSSCDRDVVSFLVNLPPDPKADLWIGINPGGISVVGVGQEYCYSVVVTNKGPDVAKGVVAKNTPWEGWSILSVQTTQGTAFETSGVVYADLGDMPPNTDAVVTVCVKALHPGGVVNEAEVASTTEDPNGPSHFVIFGQVLEAADLEISMTASSDCVGVGEKMTFGLTVKNNGPSTATAVVVSDPLPIGVGSAEVSVSMGTWEANANTVNWKVGTLAAGQSATATISAYGVGKDTFTNVATVTCTPDVDPTPENDTASVEFTVGDVTGADLTGNWASLAQSSRTSRRGPSYQLKGAFEVKNQGNVSSQASAVAFYLSDDAVLDGSDTLLKQVNVGKLRAGQTTRRNVQLRLSESASGKYVLGVIDPQGSVDEKCERNNTVVGGPVQ